MLKRAITTTVVLGLAVALAAGCGGESGGIDLHDSAVLPDAAQDHDASGPIDAGPPSDGHHPDGAELPDGATGNDAGAPDAEAPDAAGDGGTPNPQGCITGTYDPYWGNLHAHTGDSDGEGSPSQAFDQARFQGQLDFMAVTDHLEQLYNLLGIPTGEFEDCRADADAANVPGTFVAICGYEYGSGFGISGSTGHNNVFFIDYLFPQIQLNFHDFYQSVINCPSCVTQFNHPGDDPSMTWNDFEYDPAVDVKMNTFEMNGGGPVWDLLFEALDAGWHVSPVYDQDNHSADWGTKNDRRAGVYMSALTRTALHTALQQRRTFMSDDKNAALRLMGDTTCWMGSILTGYSSIDLDADASDADSGDGFVAIDFYGPGPAVLHTVSCNGQTTCSAAFTLTVTGSTYVLARATQTDGNLLISAPIWVAP